MLITQQRRLRVTNPPVVVAPPPAPTGLGATNLRTGQFYPVTTVGWPVYTATTVDAIAGDTVTVKPGLYAPIWGQKPKNLMTIKSSIPGQHAIFDTLGQSNQMLLTPVNVSATLEWLEFRGNNQEYSYAAAIHPEGGIYNLILRNLKLHHLANGILVGIHPGSTVVMEYCEVYDCGNQGGLTHNLYVDEVDLFRMTGCWSHMKDTYGDPGVAAGKVSNGHLVKSRAAVTLIEGCRLTQEYGWGNRCIDLPNGGDVTIRGCLLELNTLNGLNNYGGQAMSWGVEECDRAVYGFGDPYGLPVQKFNFQQNTVINHTQINPDGSPKQIMKIFTKQAGQTLPVGHQGPNTVYAPPPSEWSIKGNVFVGFTPPYVHQVDVGAEGQIYEISTVDNTFYTLAQWNAICANHTAPTFNFMPTTSVAGSQNWATKRYSHPLGTIARTDSQRGGMPTGATLTGFQWSPVKDSNGNIPPSEWAGLPANTWVECMGTKMESTIKPILDAGGYTLYTYGSDKLQAVMNNFCGMAWDFVGGKAWAYGGGHSGGSDNGVYQIDLNKMTWSITAYPTHPTTDMTAQQTAFYGIGTAAAGGFAANTQVLALAQSPTGYAAKIGGSFSILAWVETTGPARYLYTTDVAFTNGDTWSQGGNGLHPYQYPFPALPNIGDVLFDGRPASRHTYGGTLYSPAVNQLLSVVRSYWKCKLDGTGWIKIQDGGGKPATMLSGEMLWSHVDEVTGKVWWGGCGSNCYDNNYHLYTKGYIVDPVTMTDVATPRLTPDSAPTNLVNAGDMMMFGFKAGRKIGGWCRNNYGWTYDLDSPNARQLLYMSGVPYNGAQGEGRSSCYVPHQGRLWLFDTNSTSLPAWSQDINNPVSGGPNGSLNVDTRVETLANATSLPSSGNGLVYTRLQFLESKKAIIYFPGTLQNAWVCRLP